MPDESKNNALHTPAQHMSALDAVLAVKFENNLRKNRDYIAIADIKGFAITICKMIPPDAGKALKERVEDAYDNTAGTLRYEVMTAFVREGLDQLVAGKNSLTSKQVIDLQTAAGNLGLDGGHADNRIASEVRAALNSPPTKPDPPIRLVKVGQSQYMSAFNFVAAQILDENLKSGGRRIPADALRWMGAKLEADNRNDHETKRLVAYLQKTENIPDKDEQLRTATRIVREIFQRSVDTLLLDDTRFIENMQNMHLQFPANMKDRILKELDNPSRLPLPPLPGIKGGEWMNDRNGDLAKLNQRETNAPERIKMATKDLLAYSKEGDDVDWNNSTRIGSLDKNGVWVIKYSFEATAYPKTEYAKHDGAVTTQMRQEYRDKALRAMVEISSVANVRFEAAPPEMSELIFGEAPMTMTMGGYAQFQVREGDAAQFKGNKRHIIMSSDSKACNYGTFLHELLHGAGGMSHPGETPGAVKERERCNPNYRVGSVMSYNSINQGLPVYDIATLHRVFGEPSNAPAEPRFTSDDLRDGAALYAKNGGNIDFRSPRKDDKPRFVFTGGTISIDMSPNVFLDAQINALLTTKTGEKGRFNTQIAQHTHLDVLSDNSNMVQMNITGMGSPVSNPSMQMLYQGGAKADNLTARGGNNILTGNAGADKFIFDTQSGKNNVITDFTAKDGDKIIIRPGFTRIDIKAVGNDTLVTLTQNDTQSATATVVVKSAAPELVRSSIVVMSSERPFPQIIKESSGNEQHLLNAQPPSGMGTIISDEQIRRLMNAGPAMKGLLLSGTTPSGQQPERFDNGLSATGVRDAGTCRS